MALRKKFEQLAGQRGYTIDQTILIVAVIAILITMIIVSVGWDILTRAGGTKLASHLKQIEQANGQFFAANAAWPHEAIQTASPEANIRALLGDTQVLRSPYDGSSGGDTPRSYLPAYTVVSGAVNHSFGGGGTITMRSDGLLNGQSYLVVVMDNIPINEYISANESIDGERGITSANFSSDTSGRLRATSSGPNVVTIEYYATATN